MQGLVETSKSDAVTVFDNAVIFIYTLDDDTVVQVAVKDNVEKLAQGPFRM